MRLVKNFNIDKNEKYLFLICGIPGSRKSSFIRWYAERRDEQFTNYVVSRDAIRFALVSESEEYFSREKEVFTILCNTIRERIEETGCAVVDATHINERSRNKLLRGVGKDFLSTVHVIPLVVTMPIGLCSYANSLREGRARVPGEVVMEMYRNFREPTFNEYNYDKIYHIYPQYGSIAPRGWVLFDNYVIREIKRDDLVNE